MDGRTDIRSCEYRAKILDLEFATCIEEKNNDHYSKCSNNHFHYCAHFARSSSSPIPISDFRFAGIAVIFCWSRSCANIPKTKKHNSKVLQPNQQHQQQHYQHQQKSIKTKLTVSVSRPLMASSMVASIHSSLSVTFATSVLVWIC